MINVSKLPKSVMLNLRELDHDDEAISNMTTQQVLDEYLSWEGLSGWADTIVCVYTAITAAEIKDELCPIQELSNQLMLLTDALESNVDVSNDDDLYQIVNATKIKVGKYNV
jgi:hypothetical protein